MMIEKVLGNINVNKLHSAVIIFQSPISNEYDHREGFFTEYFEARLWLKDIESQYHEFTHQCYIDGEAVWFNEERY